MPSLFDVAALKAEFATFSAHQASIIHGLRAELDEARERVKWLEEAMTPPVQHQPPALVLTRSQRIVLLALKRTQRPLNHEMIDRWLDAGLHRRDHVRDSRFVDVLICRLRKRLGALDPPIRINTTTGAGWWMDAENKRRLQLLYDENPLKDASGISPVKPHFPAKSRGPGDTSKTR